MIYKLHVMFTMAQSPVTRPRGEGRVDYSTSVVSGPLLASCASLTVL